MVLDHALVAARDKDEMLDARFPGLIDGDLDERPVNDGQHFLGHGLGGGQEPRAQSGDGENCLFDRALHVNLLLTKN